MSIDPEHEAFERHIIPRDPEPIYEPGTSWVDWFVVALFASIVLLLVVLVLTTLVSDSVTFRCT